MFYKEFRKIKFKSIRDVFNEICDNDKVTRNDISSLTGLSIVTTGKIIDSFLNLGLISQKTENRNRVGRHASILHVKKLKYIAVIDFSNLNFSFSIFNLRSKLVNFVTYSYNDEYFYDENISFFLKEASEHMKHYCDTSLCIGIGAILPSNANCTSSIYTATCKNRSNGEPLVVSLIREYFSTENVIAECSINSAAYSVTRSHIYKSERLLMYCNISGSASNCILIENEKIICGNKSENKFGYLTASYGRPLERAMIRAQSEEAAVWEFAFAFNNLIRVLSPDRLVIECNMCNDGKFFVEQLKMTLKNNFNFSERELPEIIYQSSQMLHSHRGIIIRLREMWLKEIVDEIKAGPQKEYGFLISR